jgi:hypothetical protein
VVRLVIAVAENGARKAEPSRAFLINSVFLSLRVA